MRTDDEILSASFCIITVSCIYVGLFTYLFLGFTWTDDMFRAMGFMAILGASLIFSTTTIPYKMPALSMGKHSIDPLIFTICQAVGIVLVSLPLLLFLSFMGTLKVTVYGALGSCFFTVVAYTSVHAVNRVGISVGPGTWSGVGMITSFLLGLVVFGETVRVVHDAGIAICLLVCGVFCISTSKGGAPSEGAEVEKSEGDCGDRDYEGLPTSSMEVESASKPDTDSRKKEKDGLSAVLGVVFCVVTGLFDGCLMVPYKLYASSVITQTAAQEIHSGLNYVVSFAIGAIVCMPALCFPMIVYNRGKGPNELSLKEAFLIALPAGACSGALWALANILSVLGTATISMSVSFPLTQTCMLWAVAIGTLYFREPVDKRLQLWLGVLITLTGAYFLAASK